MKRIKSIMAVIVLVMSTSLGAKVLKMDADLTQFDYPLLIGDWYMVNSNPMDETEDYAAIHLHLQSDYSFQIQIKRLDDSVEYWKGRYAVDQDSLILGLNSHDEQIYHYANSHNQLMLGGVTFFKMLPRSIAGMWVSHVFSGAESQSSQLKEVSLFLQPDFVFVFSAKNRHGQQVVHKGVYYTEGDHLVLMYEHGEHDLLYDLSDTNTMRIDLEDGTMYAVLNRIK